MFSTSRNVRGNKTAVKALLKKKCSYLIGSHLFSLFLIRGNWRHKERCRCIDRMHWLIRLDFIECCIHLMWQLKAMYGEWCSGRPRAITKRISGYLRVMFSFPQTHHKIKWLFSKKKFANHMHYRVHYISKTTLSGSFRSFLSY